MTEPQFTVEAIFTIKDRGPCVTRSKVAAQRWPGRGERWSFEPGDWIECGDLRARVIGLEYFAVPGPQPQQSMLLGDVDPEQLAVGQVWRRVESSSPEPP